MAALTNELPLNVVVSCEHARCAVPAPLRGIGLPARVLRSHAGWDPGALPVARAIARARAAPCPSGRWSRLVADANRSGDNPRVIPPAAAGRAVPGNRDLSPAQRAARLVRYWQPYREEVERSVAAAVRRAGGCLHLSVHSFVPELRGVVRGNDVGLLFDPRRPRERALVRALQGALQARGLSVRKNFPYFGHTDGMTSHLRKRYGADRYLGVEVELNQRLSRSAAGQRRLARALVAALDEVLGRAAAATGGRRPRS